MKKKKWHEKKESCQMVRKLEGKLNRPTNSQTGAMTWSKGF
jgi:hypothetical protein